MGHSPGALLRAKPDQLPVAAAKEFTSSLTSDAGQSSACENGTPRQVGNVFVAGNILKLGGWNPTRVLKLELTRRLSANRRRPP